MTLIIHNNSCLSVRTTTETARLRRQHNLVKSALGGLILCQLDLAKPALRILDSGTADGYFLYDLRSELPHPNSTELIGTDIVTYPDTIGLPPNIKLYKQNILQPWPAEWEGTFDFVHQRAVMTNVPTLEEAVDVFRRMIRLLKPGGWIQIVDGTMPTDPVQKDDLPSLKIFKIIGAFLKAIGLNPNPGKQVFDFLEKAGGLKNMGGGEVYVSLGKGAKTKELEKMGYAELKGLVDAVAPALKEMENPPMSGEDFKKLLPLAMHEAKAIGVEMPWFAAWGQRI